MIDIDVLDIDQLEQLRDAVNRRILSMRQTKGLALPDLLRLFDEVKTTLQDQGKEWHSLERWEYMDGDVRFWLNPKDQEVYNSGWFTIDDLIAWGRETGPVVALLDDEEEDEPESSWQGAGNVSIRWLPTTNDITGQGNQELAEEYE